MRAAPDVMVNWIIPNLYYVIIIYDNISCAVTDLLYDQNMQIATLFAVIVSVYFQ